MPEGGLKFKGYLVQVRDGNDNRIGAIEGFNTSTTKAVCDNSSVTHIHHELKDDIIFLFDLNEAEQAKTGQQCL